ncbi:MAG: sensor histidine kinase [Gemmatimonadaceae bacterium]
MIVLILMSSVTFGLQLAAFVAAVVISRAAGWRRVRIVAVLAFTAGLYSLFDLIALIGHFSNIPNTSVVAENLVVAAVHVVAWLWYSFADQEGRWRSVPRWIRVLGPLHILFAALLGVLGLSVDPTRAVEVVVRWPAVTFTIPTLTPAASVSAAVTIMFLVVSLAEQVRQAKLGVRGAVPIVFGFALFVVCGILEMLVAMGRLQFIYVGELGYLGLVVPVIAQLVRKFLDDAQRLQELSTSLSDAVRTATHQRDEAREALAVQERFAALGRIAAGVGHEINNPLQYLTLSLEELQDAVKDKGVAGADESFAHAFDAAQRIHRIVDGLRVYSQTSTDELRLLDPADVVARAVAAAAPEMQSAPAPRLRLESVPHVMGDEPRLVQALVHALANAAVAVGDLTTRPPLIEIRTRTAANGDAVIEIRDNGPGFPTELMARLGEPFVSTRSQVGGSGLGLFISRGIVDAHRGVLEIENAREGGAVVRMILPAVRLA